MRATIWPLLAVAITHIGDWKKAIRAYDGRRLPPAEWYIVRSIVLERDGYSCAYCGSDANLHIDHVIPLARGGSNTFDNLVTSCGPCNQSKGTKLLAEWKTIKVASASGNLGPARPGSARCEPKFLGQTFQRSSLHAIGSRIFVLVALFYTRHTRRRTSEVQKRTGTL
ncbi:MAG: HNH endonuclease [Chthoniobacterales bacterium]|nr:HNH endonuclease [Chthoniobacterales bacterium]